MKIDCLLACGVEGGIQAAVGVVSRDRPVAVSDGIGLSWTHGHYLVSSRIDSQAFDLGGDIGGKEVSSHLSGSASKCRVERAIRVVAHQSEVGVTTANVGKTSRNDLYCR